MSDTAPIEVWYDGSCPICTRSRTWSEHRDERGRLRFRNFREASDEELPASRDRHRATLIVRTPSGELLHGFAAWRRILLALPHWRWLARLAALPPLAWIGPPVYRLISRHRHRIPMPMPQEAREDS